VFHKTLKNQQGMQTLGSEALRHGKEKQRKSIAVTQNAAEIG